MKPKESASVSIYYCLLLFGGVFADSWWIRDNKFDDLLPNTLSAPVSRVPKLKCAILCMADTACKGFFFNVEENQCLLTSSVHFQVSITKSVKGYRYYRSKPLTCPTHGTYVLHEQSGTCFELNHEAKSWKTALNICYSRRGRLAVLDSPEKEDRLLGFFKSGSLNMTFRYHIGGHRPYEKWNSTWSNEIPDFSWLNGQPVTNLTFWGPGEPNNENLGENILIIMYSSSGGWVEADAKASDQHSYICDFALL